MRGCNSLLLHYLDVVVVRVLDTRDVQGRLRAPAIAVARLRVILGILQQSDGVLDVAKPAIGIQPDLSREAPCIDEVTVPNVVGG